jgi:hypothetical protein
VKTEPLSTAFDKCGDVFSRVQTAGPDGEEVLTECLAIAHFALSSRATNDASSRPERANIRHRSEMLFAPSSLLAADGLSNDIAARLDTPRQTPTFQV